MRSGRAWGGARWCASPPTTPPRSPGSPTSRSSWSWRPGPTARPSCPRSPGVEQVFCFENRGEEIGITLSHPHGQIYAYPYVTPRTKLHAGRRPATPSATGGNLFADVLAAERKRARGWWPPTSCGRRSCPPPPAGRSRCTSTRTARCPTWPRCRRRSGPRSRRSTPRCCGASTGCSTSPMPYISAWHQAPVRQERDLAYLHLELFSIRRAPGKLKYPGRVGVGHGRLRQRRAPRGGRADASITGRSLIDFRLESRYSGSTTNIP